MLSHSRKDFGLPDLKAKRTVYEPNVDDFILIVSLRKKGGIHFFVQGKD